MGEDMLKILFDENGGSLLHSAIQRQKPREVAVLGLGKRLEIAIAEGATIARRLSC